MKRDILTTIIIVICLYVAVSGLVYRFRHPEMTETQLALHIGDWLTWRK